MRRGEATRNRCGVGRRRDWRVQRGVFWKRNEREVKGLD